MSDAPQSFEMPTLADFQAMDAQQFESFWRMYAACHRGFSPVDLERSIALKKSGWLPVRTLIGEYTATPLWRWFWEPPVGRGSLQMMAAYRSMMKAKTGFDPDDPNYGSDRLQTFAEACPTAFDPAIKKP